MRIYSLTKCNLFLTFIAIAVSLIAILFVGIAGYLLFLSCLLTIELITKNYYIFL